VETSWIGQFRSVPPHQEQSGLIGEPGVEKLPSSKVWHNGLPMAKFLRSWQTREFLLDLSLIVAGTKYRGQFEEIEDHHEGVDGVNSIIFIDELHTWLELARRKVRWMRQHPEARVIARRDSVHRRNHAGEYRKSIEKIAQQRRFQAVKVHLQTKMPTNSVRDQDRLNSAARTDDSAFAVHTRTATFPTGSCQTRPSI
jgi:ATP-dependent Clp protease ATP-binding subunit ClpA